MNTKAVNNSLGHNAPKHVTHFNWFARFETEKKQEQRAYREVSTSRERSTNFNFTPALAQE